MSWIQKSLKVSSDLKILEDNEVYETIKNKIMFF